MRGRVAEGGVGCVLSSSLWEREKSALNVRFLWGGGAFAREHKKVGVAYPKKKTSLFSPQFFWGVLRREFLQVGLNRGLFLS